MQQQYFDLGILEDEGRNVFDDIASKLEAAIMSHATGLSPEKKNEIEKNIQEIENSLVDIDESKHEHFDYIKSESKKLLTVWYEVWQINLENEAISIAFNDNLIKLKETLSIAQKTHYLESLEKLFSQFQTSEQELKKVATNNATPFNSLLTAFLNDSFASIAKNPVLLGRILPFLKDVDLFSNLKSNLENKKELKYDESWTIDIKTGGKTSDSDFTYFLWSFTEALSSIDDVKLEIQSIAKGSWFIKIKLWFKGLVGKEEVKTILEKARNSAEAYIEKPSAEVEKLKMEKEKMESERKRIEKEVENIPDAHESQTLRELNIKKIEAEIEGLKVNNALKKLEGIDKLSQLVRSGFVKVDELQIDINEILLLLKTGDNIQTGKSIDDIDSAGEIIEPN